MANKRPRPEDNITKLKQIARYACRIQKHTKYTLFRVFLCGDSGVEHCVYNLVKEHSPR